MSFIVAIDGPAGTGKGTMASRLSKKYNLVNIDTGATYRCVTLEMMNQNIAKPEEELQVGQKVNAKIINIDFENKKIELSIRELEGTSQEYKENA